MTTEIGSHLQQVLIAYLILLLGPDVAVPIAENRLEAFIKKPLDAAGGAWTATAMDKNLSTHDSILLYILKLNYTL